MKEIYVVTSGEYSDYGYGGKEKIQNSLDEINDSSMWPKENPNIGHTVSYEIYQNDILAKRFGIPIDSCDNAFKRCSNCEYLKGEK